MKDPRIEKLAKLLVEYSNNIQPKERVLIIIYGLEGISLGKEVYKQCIKRGAYPKYEIREEEFARHFFENAEEHQLNYSPDDALLEAENIDAMFQIISNRNTMELAKISQEKMIKRRKAIKKISDILHNKRWVLFEYPTTCGAQNAKMSLESWENFVFDSCLVDWKKASKEQEILKNIMEKTNEVHLVGNGTDLKVDISGQPAIKCCGKQNMPDGEVFTSPKRTGVNGYITFNTPTMYMNKEFNWIKLIFQNGKVIETDSDNKKELDEILSTDEGSRYVGEFAFGTNKNIQIPAKSILFDEKIGGSNHIALGKCYDEAPNGNDSVIHWDMILRHKDANGKVYMDGTLIQENGIWLHPELKIFN